MYTTVEYEGKTIKLFLSPKAQSKLNDLDKPLCAEMELYFSCLIRKKMRFNHFCTTDNSVKVCDNLHLRFHPIMTEVCKNDYPGDEPPTTDFPIAKVAPFVPHWVKIDYQSDQWQGEFGYG